jgi:hypothetical protein
MIFNEWLDMDTPVYVDPDEPSPEHKVYVVRSESGEYSDHVTMVKGVFSTREKAKAAIEGITYKAYRVSYFDYKAKTEWVNDLWYTVATDPKYSDDFYDAEEGLELLDVADVRPITSDGRTYMLRMPDGRPYDGYDDVTYFIDEYALDKFH